MPPTLKSGISNNLDLLRAIAVLCVLISHVLGAVGVSQAGSLGRFGVIMFFVHTSYVLMASLERLQRGAETKARLMTGFWLRRLFRIYPLAILFVILAAVCRVPSSPGLTYTWIGGRAFAANIALVQNLTYSPDILDPLWSLPLEVQMYVLLPFIFLAIAGGFRFRALLLWLLSVPLALYLPRLSGRLGVFLYAPCFISGVVSFDLRRRLPQEWRKLPSWLWPLGILLAIAVFHPLDNLPLSSKMYRAWMLSLGLGTSFVFLEEGPCSTIQRLSHWVAEHSYGIYLSHIVLIWFVLYPLAALPLWGRALVLILSLAAVPAALYQGIEQPFVRMGSYISHRLLQPHARQPFSTGSSR